MLQLPHGDVFAAAMGAHLGHHNQPGRACLSVRTDDLFAVPVVVVPGIVEEVDARVHGLGNNLVRFLLVFAEPR